MSAGAGRPRSMLRYEWDLFRAQLSELRDQVVNFVFALSFGRAEWRGRMVTLLFLALVGLIALRAHRLPEWADHFRDIFIYLLNPAVAATFTTNPILDTLRFALDGWPTLVRYLPIFILPYLIALQYAARYLADVFEQPIDLARQFIWEVALGGSSEAAVIREGEFINREGSLIYAIGGPGHVIVEMDSAALFEKPDGTPHVIGPTVDGPTQLSGFERFRQAIDLRDQHLRLDDGQDISGRTLDGIIVSAADVQVRFSLDRGGKPRSLRTPFPFKSNQVVEQLIYEEQRNVSSAPDAASDAETYHGRSHILSLSKLLHAEFKRFIGKHRLTEFLASYGESEVRRLNEQQAAIDRQRQSLSPQADSADPGAEPPKRAPHFTARSEITERFRDQFADRYRQLGLELIWIDIGTWKTPKSIVPEHYLDAWRLSSQNARDGAESTIQRIESEALIDKAIQLIRIMPIERHVMLYTRRDPKAPPIKHDVALRSIVLGYREQLMEARAFLEQELLRQDGNPARVVRDLEEIASAIGVIERVTKLWDHSPRPYDWQPATGDE